MPQTKKYADRAEQMKAYRQRVKEQREQELAAKGLPALPAIATLPGTKRWAGLQEQASALLETMRDEMQEYYDNRTDEWKEGDRGQALQERIEALESLLSDLETLPEF